MSTTPPEDDSPLEVLRVVAVCQGHRCAALLAGQEPAGLESLREAAAGSAHGVLVSATCPGLCADGPVATVGSGSAGDGTLRLAGWTVLGPLDTPAVAAVAGLLAGRGSVVVPAALQPLALSTTARAPATSRPA